MGMPDNAQVIREILTLKETLGKPEVGDRSVVICEQRVVIGIDPVIKIARLTCTCTQYQRSFPSSHCPHIQTVLLQELDGKKLPEGTKVALPSFLEVPIFLHNPALAIPVRLAAGPFENSFSVSLADEQIGFIFLGQGRKSIRTHILDWLIEKGSIDSNLPFCTAPQHYKSLPWQLEHFNLRNKIHLTNLADLLLTGRCRPCNEDSGVPDVRLDT